ncbi:hypothetical protein LWC34_43555 [Kibdelosporangium philippinense]|uniref:Uncharacterized protein n=1 Tax=Kibdelosporangium philippinense TaxID=211113 RepID=A0ABS8ZPY2_9PSEU|nr:hypothetical protein [Kibdelosporangium philippinense]MCE7009639.1 hypothetical protein [Kibdelosporangium philippinense]
MLLALSAACGAQTQTGSAPPPSELPSESSPTSEPELPAPGAKLVTKLDAAKLPEGYPRKVWTEGDGSRIGVTAQEGGCTRASVEIGEQSAEKVVLTMVETSPSTEQMCTMDIRYPTFTVNLNAPLAERPVILDYQQRKV